LTITLYGIKNCDTMKKARTWLDSHGVQYEFHDYKAAGIDPAVLAFTLGVSLLSVVVFAMAPLIQLRHRDLATTLRGTGQRTSGGGSSHKLRTTLVVAEIALAVIPVIGSGLMIRAFWKLRQVEAGFDPRGVTAFSLQLPANKYQNTDRLRFANQLEERLAALPGVKYASMASGLPPLRPINANDTDIEDYQATPDGPAENVDYWNAVGGDYFRTMGIRTLEGRTFEPSDRNDSAQKVMVINQAMARRMNTYKKLAFSRSGRQKLTEWNNTEQVVVATDDELAKYLANLKAQPGGDIHLSGGASFAQSVIALNLVDEFYFFVYPVVSPGASWFSQLPDKRDLQLLGASSYENDVVGLRYLPRKLVFKARPDSFSELLT